jgi:hypothetical protein
MVDNIAKMPYFGNRILVVRIAKRVQRRVSKLPKPVHQLFEALVLDLMKLGPIQFDWPNYSKLGDDGFHCHLNYRFVVVWVVVNKEIRILEVTYAGSRENAPY